MLQDFIDTNTGLMTPAETTVRRGVQCGGMVPCITAPEVRICVGGRLTVSGVLPVQGGHASFGGEGGHVTLAACNDEEAALIAWCLRRFGHAAAECFVSWRGLQALHEAIGDVRGLPVKPLFTEDIVQRARQGSDTLCGDAVNIFCAMLATIASNLALTLGAFGGVTISGDVVSQLGRLMLHSPFRERFDAKGRFAAYLAQMPVFLMVPES